MYDISDLVRLGILRPDEEPLAYEIQHKHGLATFAAFIHGREQQHRASAESPTKEGKNGVTGPR